MIGWDARSYYSNAETCAKEATGFRVELASLLTEVFSKLAEESIRIKWCVGLGRLSDISAFSPPLGFPAQCVDLCWWLRVRWQAIVPRGWSTSDNPIFAQVELSLVRLLTSQSLGHVRKRNCISLNQFRTRCQAHQGEHLQTQLGFRWNNRSSCTTFNYKYT